MPANPLGVALRNRRAGQHTLVWARPDLQAPENFTLTSPAFDHGAPIPEKHRGRLRGHALTLGIDPSLSGIPENALTDPSPVLGIRHGKGALGRRGWAGPMPIRSHGPHTYAFQLFALDQAPGLPASFTFDDLVTAVKGRAIGRARLDGTYEIR
jgi:phosphatidylethanolamine-binding protein (PEBP) family uncharacterized protein